MGIINRVAGVNISGTEELALAPTMSNSLSVDTAAGKPFAVSGLNHIYNNATWEWQRANHGITVLASANRSADTTSSLMTNTNFRGAMFFLDVTSAFPGSASTTVALVVQARDPVGLRFQTIATGAAVSASGITALMVYPGISESSGALTKVNAALPRDFQVIADMSTGATSRDITFSIGMEFIV